ncbi:MAG TPA: 50S ribosomal protein L4 [Anaerolineaceae bacterium]|nr:50S ribosomal protein L4 [Anaerolineaceae bacterium]HOR84381.1 50S ribosomal protein L4 [Anaerolineaceae bacterium]HOT52927.1 50S ribosomal protein L4 [Anaerolineaceae bacterium]HPL43304.1 50S ribosomal protein L4 [Anaerolineaceae bacterium]HQK42005.1 50S ribosomal protein L4 [Anaerolineaceae bacterium]
MKADVFNLQGEKSSTVELPDEIFAAKVNVDLMHQAYLRQMANARLGTHSTKRRSEVAGGGAKPWRQKGTGRARQGSRISAQWVGGGRVHTPKPRDYTQEMPRKMRRAALRSALTVKAMENGLVLVSDLALAEPKASLFSKALKALTGDARTLVLVPDKSETYTNVIKSGRNLVNSKLLQANYLNIRDLLQYEKVIIPLASLDVIKSYLG